MIITYHVIDLMEYAKWVRTHHVLHGFYLDAYLAAKKDQPGQKTLEKYSAITEGNLKHEAEQRQ